MITRRRQNSSVCPLDRVCGPYLRDQFFFFVLPCVVFFTYRECEDLMYYVRTVQVLSYDPRSKG